MKTAFVQALGHASDLVLTLSTSKIEILFSQAGLMEFQPPARATGQRYAKTELVAATLLQARKAAANGNPDVEDALWEFIRLAVQHTHSSKIDALREKVRALGYEVKQDSGTVRFLPLDDPRAPLSGVITALEADFDRLGWDTAKGCYQEAIENLVANNFRAANGQMRAMFEEVLAQVAILNGFTRHQQGDGGRAIRHLRNVAKVLPDDDGGSYIWGLWKITHTNGPHPGTSGAGEAQFRVQALTSAARYLINRFAPAPTL